MNAFGSGFVIGFLSSVLICGGCYIRYRLSKTSRNSGSARSTDGRADDDDSRIIDFEQRATASDQQLNDLNERAADCLDGAGRANTAAKELIEDAKTILRTYNNNQYNGGDTNMIRTTRMRYEGLQTLLRCCGEEGCLFLSLISIAEEVEHTTLDLIEVIRTCLEKGWIEDDFYCNDSLAILSYLTNKTWTRKEVSRFPSLKSHDYVIANYYNERTGCVHRRRNEFDTLESSITVREGYIQSYYIYSWR